MRPAPHTQYSLGGAGPNLTEVLGRVRRSSFGALRLYLAVQRPQQWRRHPETSLASSLRRHPPSCRRGQSSLRATATSDERDNETTEYGITTDKAEGERPNQTMATSSDEGPPRKRRGAFLPRADLENSSPEDEEDGAGGKPGDRQQKKTNGRTLKGSSATGKKSRSKPPRPAG
ncbi:hypothetical protein THAOC_08141 [Thalassiosira oceanica]|uniref:Uncharacterized protein n=1 Tax=Thalassiosira oceanica TaxID=159749 RepID=K0SVP6_THAOC|nr:hypothetical protein THAOC_08141 [Thalassiosira oceanica]|eukprot:EJK70493.1 hypothetical protein THAOC_08141 [Thalassiosira oceanica]